MSFDQARSHQPPADIDRLLRRAQVATDGRDVAALDTDVGGVGRVGQTTAPQEEIQHSGPILLTENGSLQEAGAGPKVTYDTYVTRRWPVIRTIRTVCAHDCPDQCSLLAHVEDGRIVRIEGDPTHPFTAGFACAKVHRRPRVGPLARACAHPPPPDGHQGAGPLCADHVGRRARRDRQPLAGDHARRRRRGNPRLRLQCPSGPDQSGPAAGAVPRPWCVASAGRDRVRHVRGSGVGCRMRKRGRGRPGNGDPLGPDHRLGGGPSDHQRAHLALRRAGARSRRDAGCHRATP